jgi:formylglycine-generating enzyme required for sulfatase activity
LFLSRITDIGAMSDIFISYASEDKPRVEALARALERKGWSVWWDRRIRIGRSFDEVIEEALDGSKAVVVVWTGTSVKSQWVKNEAREGLRRRVLFPVMLLEEVKLPLEFRDVQTAHLMDWQSGQEHHGFTQFVDDLTQVIGVPSNAGIPSAPVTQNEGPVPPPASPTPTPESEPLLRRIPEVKQEPERQEPEPSAAVDDGENSGSQREAFQSEETAEVGQESAQVRERQSGESTGTGQTAESFPYLPIGLGALAVLGVLLYFLLFSQGSRPVTRDVAPYQPPVPAPSPRAEVTTPPPAPAAQPSAPAVTEKPTVKQGAGPAKTITGKDGVPMVLVPAGEFMMGSRADDQSADDDERPAHRVYLDAYYIDQYEVTTARYAKFFKATNRPQPEYWSANVVSDHGNKPVVGVDWKDATAYCSWAGKRLPTEAEWEKAARGTDQGLYPWGNQPPNEQRANFDHCCDFKDYGVLTDVGSYEAGKSPYGVYDMAGNVWEWVEDWYDDRYYSKSLERNPTGPSSDKYRVIRGGSWGIGPGDLRSAGRLRHSPAKRRDYIGFRCAQDIPK